MGKPNGKTDVTKRQVHTIANNNNGGGGGGVKQGSSVTYFVGIIISDRGGGGNLQGYFQGYDLRLFRSLISDLLRVKYLISDLLVGQVSDLRFSPPPPRPPPPHTHTPIYPCILNNNISILTWSRLVS